MNNIDELIESNSKLIYSVVKIFSNNSNKEDLYQVGVMGMIKAYNNFDSTINVKFTTYAYPYILGEIKRYVREDKGIKISRGISKFNYKVDQVSSLLSQKLFRNPTTKEIADFMEVDEIYVIESINSRREIKSIDEAITSDSKDLTLHETIPSKKVDIDALISLKEELNKLNDFEKELITSRYFCDNTQSETANILGISQVQVSRNEQKILSKLRANIN